MADQIALIREAARHMRERAQSAQPGPWHIGNAVDPTQLCNIHTFPQSSGVADGLRWLDAEYIASWHPGVALAVADLLQVLSRMPSIAHAADLDAAQRVARAYLGRSR